jgi:hypothetical protein
MDNIVTSLSDCCVVRFPNAQFMQLRMRWEDDCEMIRNDSGLFQAAHLVYIRSERLRGLKQ